MKIVFFGTPHLASEILKQLVAAGHDIAAVVTQPDRASGRGRQLHFCETKTTALEAGIKVLQPEKISDTEVLDEIEAINADLHVVAAYAQKLPNRLLEMAPVGCINVHPSLLPKYRGAAPMMAAILNGDRVGGVTIMNMAEKMDAGDILMQREMPLDEKETNVSIEEKAIKLGGELLLETIEGLKNGTITPLPQDESKSTYVRQLGKEAGLIDWSEPAAVIERKIRAYDPWPGTFTSLDGKTLKIFAAEVQEMAADGVYPAGSVAASGKNKLTAACGQGYLDILEVQLEGKKRMSIEEFLRGRKVETTAILGK